MSTMLPDIVILKTNRLTEAALHLARVFYRAGEMQERSLRFGVQIAALPEITKSQAEVIVTVAIREKSSDRNGLIYAGMVE